MIEGGGLGKVAPKEVGPAMTHVTSGVIDVLVKDESSAILIAQKYLAFWQGDLSTWSAADQTLLREIIPQDRKRTFDMRELINILVDVDSSLELQKEFGPGLITCLARIEGRAIGIMANDCTVDAGAISARCADKAVDFLERCNRLDIPVISLVDTPGIMVGPAAEEEGTVRSAGRLFNTGARFGPTLMSVVIRRAYGLGAMAMMGGSTRRPIWTLSWPDGEFGAMGLEGAVKLGYRRELEAVKDPNEKEALFQKMVDEAYHRGRAINAAAMLEIDDVIDPVDTRRWISQSLENQK